MPDYKASIQYFNEELDQVKDEEVVFAGGRDCHMASLADLKKFMSLPECGLSQFKGKGRRSIEVMAGYGQNIESL